MTWDELCSKVKTGAEIAVEKISQTTDIATLRVKLSVEERKLKDAYAALGKVAYRHFSGTENLAEPIAEAMIAAEKQKGAVDALKAEIKKRTEANEA